MVQAFDPATTPVLDEPTLGQILALDDGQLGLLQEMAALYTEDLPDRLHALEVTAGEQNLSDISEVAHAVKGAASTMGAQRVRAVAALLEAGGRRGDLQPADLKQLLARLNEAYAESVTALQAYIQVRINP